MRKDFCSKKIFQNDDRQQKSLAIPVLLYGLKDSICNVVTKYLTPSPEVIYGQPLRSKGNRVTQKSVN